MPTEREDCKLDRWFAALQGSKLEADGAARLGFRFLSQAQRPSLVATIPGKIKPRQAAKAHLGRSLAQIRAAVKGFDVTVVVVHHVDAGYAHELLRDGCVDAVELADTAESPWIRDTEPVEVRA